MSRRHKKAKIQPKPRIPSLIHQGDRYLDSKGEVVSIVAIAEHVQRPGQALVVYREDKAPHRHWVRDVANFFGAGGFRLAPEDGEAREAERKAAEETIE